MTLHTYPDRDMMMLAVANALGSELAAFLRRQDRVTLSVPGGTTPGPVFDVLAGLDLDWARVSVVLNDERWVPETSPRSNTRLVRERLLQGRAAAATLVPLVNDAPTPDEGMAALAEGLAPHLPVTVLLLGMGEDMHTASLFPGADRLADALSREAPPLMALRADAAAEPRITLTAPVLRAAMSTHVLITGAAKRAALDRAAGLPETEAPINVALPDATVHWAE
jgi:6-phosphogluconolactonase